ncbi:MAG: rRNA pseudouridine synthase [Ignavibacteria bacterium]|nr:rRNA pseudouridine synthase [Ignavibacteria bacterium]
MNAVSVKNSKEELIFSLPRAISKLGYCSRKQAEILIRQKAVRINGIVESNPSRRVNISKDRITIDEKEIFHEQKIYLMLNKPRGLITTTSDEKGRATVFDCFKDANLPRIFPVGRLDKASEGLLLFTNDSDWANRITDPASHIDKTYHVQIDRLADDTLLNKIRKGIKLENGELLRVKKVNLIRQGKKNSWLEITLDEGKNRQIRRLLDALNIKVLRLIRISIGNLRLGKLPKGKFRFLAQEEIYSSS